MCVCVWGELVTPPSSVRSPDILFLPPASLVLESTGAPVWSRPLQGSRALSQPTHLDLRPSRRLGVPDAHSHGEACLRALWET